MSIWARVSKLELLLKGLVEDFLSIRNNHEHCQECGGIFMKTWMKKIPVYHWFVFGNNNVLYFCKAHTPKYDEIINGEYFINTPSKQVRCDKDGKAIKNEKAL